MNKLNLTIVGKINPDGKEELINYIEKVGELYKKVNATQVVKFKITDSLIGDYIPSIVSVMEFSDMNSLKEVFESEEYKKIIPLRNKAFSKLEAYISE